jgi:4-coumarate--CoA ligase (photoactive yellow protein activation family)
MLQRHHLVRVIVGLIRDEVKRHRKTLAPNDPFGEIIPARELNDGTPITGGGFGADSLELLALAGRLNQFFHLHETGIEDYLLRRRTLGDWTDVVQQALAAGTSGITFQTSGSTGMPKTCTHAWQTLQQEAELLSTLLANNASTRFAGQIVACVQPQHIYGFLFTALLPSLTGCTVLEGLHSSPAMWLQTLQRGDVVVSFPTYWQYVVSSIAAFPKGICGVTSTAPCPENLTRELLTKGLERLVEVYGSSETGGVGFRTNTPSALAEWYELFPYWTLEQVHNDDDTHHDDTRHYAVRHNSLQDATQIPLADALEHRLECQREGTHAAGERHLFKPVGRLDGAVQVGGVNVFPQTIAERLCTLECVKECAVRLMRPDEGTRLKAFMVLHEEWAGEQREECISKIQNFIRQHYSAAEQPTSLTFGVALPRNSMGKLTDW